MVENLRGLSFNPTEMGLKIPDKELVGSDRKKIKAEDLSDIFGVDIRLLTQNQLVKWGILTKNNTLDLLSDPIIHRYIYKDVAGQDMTVESDGQYFLETIVGNHGILASYLPPFSSTTEHEHNDPIKEIYKQIAGKSIVNVGHKEIVLDANMGPIEVPLDTEHQVFTSDNPAFILIVMREAGRVPRNQWHRPTNRYKGKVQ